MWWGFFYAAGVLSHGTNPVIHQMCLCVAINALAKAEKNTDVCCKNVSVTHGKHSTLNFMTFCTVD